MSSKAILVAMLALAAARLQAQTAQSEFFETGVRPVLSESCLGCHGTGAMGGLGLDSREGLLKRGKSGPAIVPGDPDNSLLMAAITHRGALKMPMGGERLTDDRIAALATWIRNGAAWPAPAAVSARSEAALGDHFEAHIRPVLAQQCFACHTNSKSGGLRLDSRDDILAGGETFGVDLVDWMVRLGANELPALDRLRTEASGSAIEVRI